MHIHTYLLLQKLEWLTTGKHLTIHLYAITFLDMHQMPNVISHGFKNMYTHLCVYTYVLVPVYLYCRNTTKITKLQYFVAIHNIY